MILPSTVNQDFSHSSATLILSPPTSVTQCADADDVFSTPTTTATLTRFTDVLNVRHAQKTYGKPPITTPLVFNPTDNQIPVLPTIPTPQIKPSNQNSLLKALISRPCMKIPTSNIMKSIRFPVGGNTIRASLIQKPAKKTAPKTKRSGSQSSGRSTSTYVRAASSTSTTPVRAVFDVPAAQRTLTTETITCFAVTSAVNIYTDSASHTLYRSTASLITIPVSTVAYSTNKTFTPRAPIIQRGRASTPILIPFTASLTSHMVSRNTSRLATVTSLARSLTTATLTSYATSNTNTNVKIVSDNLIPTISKGTTRLTYATTTRNVPSGPTVLSTLMSPVITSSVIPKAVTTSTITSSSSVKTTTPESPFLEPLPVTKSRTTPAARTFSGPRKVTFSPRQIMSPIPQRILIRHPNPQAFVDRFLKNPALRHRNANATETRLDRNSSSFISPQGASTSASLSEPLPKSVPTMPTTSTTTSTTTTTTTMDDPNHTLVIPHYKDTVFKNLSNLANSAAARGVVTTATDTSTAERVVIRRPVAYFSPRRTFPCVTSTQTSTAITPPSPPPPPPPTTQRTLVRAVPVNINRTHIINLHPPVITSENLIVQSPPGVNVTTITTNVTTSTTTS